MGDIMQKDKIICKPKSIRFKKNGDLSTIKNYILDKYSFLITNKHMHRGYDDLQLLKSMIGNIVFECNHYTIWSYIWGYYGDEAVERLVIIDDHLDFEGITFKLNNQVETGTVEYRSDLLLMVC